MIAARTPIHSMANPMIKTTTHPTNHPLLRGCLGACLAAWLAAGCTMNDAGQPGKKPDDRRGGTPTIDEVAAKLLADARRTRPVAAPPADSVARAEPAPLPGLAPSGAEPGIIPTAADLAITITDGVTTVAPGGSLTYTITASNAGPDSVIGATVADTFPAALTCTWTCVGAGGGACTAAGSGNISDAVTLPIAGSVTYTATCSVNPLASGTLSNTAVVVPPGSVVDPAPGNNAATDSDTITLQPALLVGSKTVSGDFTQGGTITYTIALSNIGAGNQGDNPGNEMADVLPAEVTLVSASASSGTAIATIGTNTVTWNGAIAAGSNVTITIVATITAAAGARVSNQAAFVYDSDGNGTNDSAGTTDAFVCAD